MRIQEIQAHQDNVQGFCMLVFVNVRRCASHVHKNEHAEALDYGVLTSTSFPTRRNLASWQGQGQHR